MSGEPPAKKRRGRPTKAEAAVRAQAEAERLAKKAAAAAEKARIIAEAAAVAAVSPRKMRGRKVARRDGE